MAAIGLSGAMLLLSSLCLCEGGEMVGYYLVAAAFGLVPFGCGPRRPWRWIGLLLVLSNMLLASADHDRGVAFNRRFINTLEDRATTEPADAAHGPPAR